MSGVEALLEAVAAWAAGREDVRGAFLLGSHARADTPADEFSDVDVVLFADDPARLVDDASWLATFGEPLLTFVEATAVGGERERRVLYADGLEVDFAVFPAAAAPALAADPETAGAVARGHRVLHDETGLAAALAAATAEPPARREPVEVVHDFWYHALWTAKKLRRGEGVTARRAFDCALNGLLIELAREHALRFRPGTDTWHRDRFVERWADPRAVEAAWLAAASPDELPATLRRLCDAFDGLAAELGALDAGAAAARVRLGALLG